VAKIVLISCASKKLPSRAEAQDLYISPLFKKNLSYAKFLKADKVFILSAKHGLLGLDKVVYPYDQTLNRMSFKEIDKWANLVLRQLKKVAQLDKDEFIFLAGNNYRKYLLPHITNYKIPLKGLGIGKQLQWLGKKLVVANNCRKAHLLLRKRKRYSFPFSKNEIPKNGIYILFEKGELAHGGERIVRVGTHTGQNQLPPRLFQHFLNENKDRSIFRKNIGRALLSKSKNPFLEKWDLDLTTRAAKEKYSRSIDFKKQKRVERRVSKYIQNSFTFCILQVDNKSKRLKLESKIISTISCCWECGGSKEWLGNYSPKSKIKESGLWLVNELWKIPLTCKELESLSNFS